MLLSSIILLFITALLLSGCGTVDYTITAQQLATEYEKKPTETEAKYKNKLLKISGEVLYKGQFVNSSDLFVSLYGTKNVNILATFNISEKEEVNSVKLMDVAEFTGVIVGVRENKDKSIDIFIGKQKPLAQRLFSSHSVSNNQGTTELKPQRVSLSRNEEQPPQVLQGHTGYVFSIAFSPDGRTLASGGRDKENSIKLWDVATGRELRKMNAYTRQVHSVAFSPDGRILASGNSDNTIKLWEVASGRELLTINGIMANAVVFSPDGRILASGNSNNTIKLWDVTTGRELQSLNGHMNGVYAVVFSPDGRTMASGSRDNTIKLWEVATGRELQTIRQSTSDGNPVAFSPNGLMLASAGNDKTIRLWDVATGREVRNIIGSSSGKSVVFSPDGRTLASGSDDHTIRLFDVSTGQELRTLRGHSLRVMEVSFSPDGSLLASGSVDTTVRLWDVTKTTQR